MRRMMHAALLFSFVLTSNAVQAQQNSLLVGNQPSVPSYSAPYGEGATIYSDNTNGAAYQSHENAGIYQPAESTYAQGQVAAPQFMKYGSCRPHSSVALFLQCDYSSRNLWAGYGQERAALLSHMMRHVDGTCDCCRTYDNACQVGGGACGSGCGTTGSNTCQTGCGPVANRYKLSTLHANASNECSTGGCGLGQRFGWQHSHRPLTFGAPVDSCGACTSNEVVGSPYEAAQYAPPSQVAPQPVANTAYANQQGRPVNNAPYRTR